MRPFLKVVLRKLYSRKRKLRLIASIDERSQLPHPATWKTLRRLVCVACFSVFPNCRILAAAPDQVDKALERARDYLYGEQNDGLWEPHPAVPTNEEISKLPNNESAGQWGGQTALAVYALLASGESPQSDKLAKAISFLKQANLKGTYALGLRTQIYPFLPPGKDVREDASADMRRLASAANPSGSARGLYEYLLDNKVISDHLDHSVSQYGVLGAWACQRAGADIPAPFWQAIENAWVRDQAADGSWGYGESTEMVGVGKAAQRHSLATASMTVAGTATLYVTQDFTNPGLGLRCDGNIFNPHIEAGLHWISENFDRVFTDPGLDSPYYALYGVERVGVASGRKYFGKVDWYQKGTEFLLKTQLPTGDWGGVQKTCFAMLFLSRGRAPVIWNKLQYDVNGRPGNWNERPRDVANLTRWIARQNERDLNWQVVNLSSSVDELLEAPILYISGNEPLKFTPQEEAKLRQFCEDGGLILANSDCDHVVFADSFRKLGSRLFHQYEFHDLPKTHVIFTNEQFPRGKWKTPPNVLALGNGVREFMILPAKDEARSWQLQNADAIPSDMQFPDDLLLYAIDKQNLREKGGTYLVRENTALPITRTIKLARLQYNGNWDPEPGGWRRMQAILHNTSQIRLDITSVNLGDHKLGNGDGDGPKVATLTGTAMVQLSADARDDLKQFVEGGGTLIVDCAGGSSAFASAIETELQHVGGPTVDAQLKQFLPDTDAVFHLPGGDITDFLFRSFAKQKLSKFHSPMISVLKVNNRPAVYYSRLDLSAGLVGQPTDGIYGYTPQTATQIMTNLVISGGLGPKAPVAATQP